MIDASLWLVAQLIYGFECRVFLFMTQNLGQNIVTVMVVLKTDDRHNEFTLFTIYNFIFGALFKINL